MSKHTISFRYELIRDNINIMDIKAGDGGQISCDMTAAIKRSISCNLYLPEEANMLTDEVRVSIVKDGVENHLGIFTITTLPKNVSKEGVISYNCEGYDRTYYVQRKRLESRSDAYIASGTLYTEAIEQLLVDCGIKDILIDPSELAISIDREDWDVGTSYLDIVNTLLNEINYNSLWFDEEGNARSEAYTSIAEKDVDFEYLSGRNSIILREHTLEDDYFSAYNVFTVGVSNPADEPVYATAVNSSIQSKISTVYRGRIMSPVEMLDSVSDLETLQQYANNLVLKSRISNETAVIKTEIEAGHDIGNIIAIQLPELSGKFEETYWSIPLQVGLMEHKIRRAVYV